MQNSTPPLNNQDFFNRLWQHFIVEQHPPCMNAAGRCVYRNEANTNGCAIGCMLPDEMALKADDSNHGSGIHAVLDRYDDIQQWFINVDDNLCISAQNLHDKSTTHGINVADLHDLAVTWGLTVPR